MLFYERRSTLAASRFHATLLAVLVLRAAAEELTNAHETKVKYNSSEPHCPGVVQKLFLLTRKSSSRSYVRRQSVLHCRFA